MLGFTSSYKRPPPRGRRALITFFNTIIYHTCIFIIVRAINYLYLNTYLLCRLRINHVTKIRNMSLFLGYIVPLQTLSLLFLWLAKEHYSRQLPTVVVFINNIWGWGADNPHNQSTPYRSISVCLTLCHLC
jgi:hypothetical protein